MTWRGEANYSVGSVCYNCGRRIEAGQIVEQDTPLGDTTIRTWHVACRLAAEAGWDVEPFPAVAKEG